MICLFVSINKLWSTLSLELILVLTPQVLKNFIRSFQLFLVMQQIKFFQPLCTGDESQACPSFTSVSPAVNQLIPVAFSFGNLVAVLRVIERGIVVPRRRRWRFGAAARRRDPHRAQRSASYWAAAPVLVVRRSVVLRAVLLVFGCAVSRVVVLRSGGVDASIAWWQRVTFTWTISFRMINQKSWHRGENVLV